MINKNYAEDIRKCERIKFDQALYILTMYEKKIRKNRKLIGNNGVIDAETEMQDIICSWKNKWKMDLTKPILNCVTSVYPRILIDLSKQDDRQLASYYALMNKFLTRLRTEHEDETNFKLVMQVYDRQVQYMSSDKYLISSKATVKGFLTMARDLSHSMIEKIIQNSNVVADEMLDVNTDNLEWQAYRPLRYIREIAKRALLGEHGQMELENDIEPKCQKTENLIAFSSNIVKIMEKIKESEHGSTLITIQPKIDELTLLIHPLLIAISSNFKKENLQKNKDYDWSKIDVQSVPMMQNLKSSYNCSKVVLINLDGYESEFNLEFVRNFKKHLMYISFPKQEAKLDDVRQIYSRRFFKKLMFRYSQNLYESYDNSAINEDYKLLTRMDRLNFNPEDYHCATQRLYQTKNDKSNEDFNQNIYCFPLRMSILYQKFPEIFENKQDIENHESYFIRFIVKDFLLNQIREFNPTLIMISYSGRIHIEDHHFVQLIQQFTKIANYKLVFFPNLTTSFCKEEMAQVEEEEGEMCDYDNYINDNRINFHFNQYAQMMDENESSNNEHWIELFNKVSRFLKVSSGTYNLNRSFEQEPLVSKYKNQFILTYVDELMTVLGKEYNNIDKIRFRNKDLSILPKLFQQNIKNIKKTFEHTVPKLYFDIYDIIEYLLLERNNKVIAKREELLKQYKINIELYKELIDRLFDEILNKSNYEVTSVDIQRMGEEIEKEKYKKMKEIFSSLKESHLFQISSEKFQEKVNIFFKTRYQNKQYNQITEETESLRGLYETSFYLSPGKTILKLYESTKLLYKTDQVNSKSMKIPILIMNNLTDGTSENSFENYYTEMDISSHQGGDKKTFEQKKCPAHPIVFQNEDGSVEKDRKLFILAEWNYFQSENYLFLYWPSKYDFLKAFLLKLMNKPYQPEIMNTIYICKKGFKQIIFKKVNVVSDCEISGRMGCSGYEFSNKIFIFGGFYEKEKNYLELQHDIITFDIQLFETTGGNKLYLENVKNRLYNRQTFDARVHQRAKPNSFIRPRMEFEFFEKEQLYAEEQDIIQDQVKTVIMLGGYGQNFLRPYSLLTYFYYVLKFNRDNRQLQSIQKKFIYNKAIPINIKEMTKNLGVIKTNKKTKGGILETKKLTDPDSYTLYRNSFKIDIKDGEEDFNYKFKYMFSEEQYKTFKHEIKKIQELRAEEFDNNQIVVEKDPKNNHIITLEKEGKRKRVTLRLEMPPEKIKKIGCPKEVTLTHESIIYLDGHSSLICAIVKHQKYTQGKSVLVEYNTKCLQGLNFEQDILVTISMTWIKQFDYDLSLHVVIVCNKNTVAILHGQKLISSEKIKEFIIKKKKGKNQIGTYEIKQRQTTLRKNEETTLIKTVFCKIRNKIMSTDFIALGDSYQFYISCQQIELNSANDQYRWNVSNLDKFDTTAKYQFCLSEKNFIKMKQIHFLEFAKHNNENYLVVEYNRKKYICQVSKHNKKLELADENSIKLESSGNEKGFILNKTEDLYNDRDFM